MTEAIIAVVALLLGLIIGWWFAGRPVAALKAERDEARREADERRTRLAETAVEIKALQTERAERDAAHARQLEELGTRFEAVAGRVLEQAQGQLITRAEQRFAEAETRNQASIKAVLAPVAETLAKYETRLGEVEKVRSESSVSYTHLTLPTKA